ncbi:hypothetical protein WH35_00225, partial [Wolbachia endosymbiont of Drosophila incompta]
EPGFLLKLFEELKFFGLASRSYISGVLMQLSKTGSAANSGKLNIICTKSANKIFFTFISFIIDFLHNHITNFYWK